MRLQLISFFAVLLPLAAQGMPDGNFDGNWVGQWSDGSGDVNFSLDIDGDVFTANLEGDHAQLPLTEFSDGPSVGVFEGHAPGGMMDWLILSNGPDPLQGKPLTWARLDNEKSLSIYRFELAPSGEFEMVQWRFTPEGGSLNLQKDGVETAGSIEALSAVLSRR